MRTGLTAALLLGLAVLAAPAGADTFLADFSGYDWTSPTPNCPTCIGNHYDMNGRVGTANPTYLTYNFTLNEYTCVISGLVIVGVDYFPGTTVVHLSGGSIYLIGDSKTTGTHAAYNRDGLCDPVYDRLHFVDGDTTLYGTFSSFDIAYDPATFDGNFVGVTNWIGGSQIGNIPANQRDGWTFAALGRVFPGMVPCGYFWQADGNCVLQEPVPVEQKTWGDIKTMFIRH